MAYIRDVFVKVYDLVRWACLFIYLFICFLCVFCLFVCLFIYLFNCSLIWGYIQCTSTVLPRSPGGTTPYIKHKNNIKTCIYRIKYL